MFKGNSRLPTAGTTTAEAPTSISPGSGPWQKKPPPMFWIHLLLLFFFPQGIISAAISFDCGYLFAHRFYPLHHAGRSVLYTCLATFTQASGRSVHFGQALLWVAEMVIVSPFGLPGAWYFFFFFFKKSVTKVLFSMLLCFEVYFCWWFCDIVHTTTGLGVDHQLIALPGLSGSVAYCGVLPSEGCFSHVL